MKLPLDIIGCGAVTAVGLTAPQTCAAIRAGISAFREAYVLPPPDDVLMGAPVPAERHLKRTQTEWLTNLAAKAIDECLQNSSAKARTALLLNVPESRRNHPGMRNMGAGGLLARVHERLGSKCDGPVMAFEGGRAGGVRALEYAQELIGKGEADQCVVGGIDSLLNEIDIELLRRTYRIKEPENSHGLIPGEGAAFVLLAAQNRCSSVVARIAGVGIAQEADTVLGARFSQGRGLQEALKLALNNAELAEANIDFRVSVVNGERYHEWESVMGAMRFYRTRRENFACWYAAAAVGDLGSAAGTLALVVAATGIARGYSPGATAMCEASSDEGLRAACVVRRVGGGTRGQ